MGTSSLVFGIVFIVSGVVLTFLRLFNWKSNSADEFLFYGFFIIDIPLFKYDRDKKKEKNS